jgi:hypothetical protein
VSIEKFVGRILACFNPEHDNEGKMMNAIYCMYAYLFKYIGENNDFYRMLISRKRELSRVGMTRPLRAKPHLANRNRRLKVSPQNPVFSLWSVLTPYCFLYDPFN